MNSHPVPLREIAVPTGGSGSPLLERVRQAACNRGDSQPTADNLVSWVRSFILFHDKRHPSELGLPEVTHFLEHVVKTDRDPLPALAQSRAALMLLYRDVLGRDLGELPQPRPPRLLDQLRLVLRVRHYAPGTEDSYVQWARRFILFHNKRHPRTMNAVEVEQFLTHLAAVERVSASTQNQALNALIFFYTQVLEIEVGRVDAVRARRGKRLPVVLAPEEVAATLEHVTGADGLFRTMASLLYGCGLRVSECCGLRVRDLDLARGQVMVRGGKGNKDRVVMLPKLVRPELERHLAKRKQLHDRDQERGVARVDLPDALERKYPRAAQSYEWQFVFASRQLSNCPRTGRIGRHHILEGSLQRAVVQAGVAAGLNRAIHCHTFRHSFATSRRAGTRTRRRYPLDSIAARPRKFRDDDDLHSRSTKGRVGNRQPTGPSGRHLRGATSNGRVNGEGTNASSNPAGCRTTAETPILFFPLECGDVAPLSFVSSDFGMDEWRANAALVILIEKQRNKRKRPYVAAVQIEDEKQRKRPYRAALQIRNKNPKILAKCSYVLALPKYRSSGHWCPQRVSPCSWDKMEQNGTQKKDVFSCPEALARGFVPTRTGIGTTRVPRGGMSQNVSNCHTKKRCFPGDLRRCPKMSANVRAGKRSFWLPGRTPKAGRATDCNTLQHKKRMYCGRPSRENSGPT